MSRFVCIHQVGDALKDLVFQHFWRFCDVSKEQHGAACLRREPTHLPVMEITYPTAFVFHFQRVFSGWRGAVHVHHLCVHRGERARGG